jgi:hypothetical protein
MESLENMNFSELINGEDNLPNSSVELVDKLIHKYPNFDIGDVAEILPEVIKHVQKFNKFSGEEKKEYIVNILLIIVDKTDGPGNDDIWDPILKKLIPPLVDTLLGVQDGKIKLKDKKVSKVFSKCC